MTSDVCYDDDFESVNQVGNWSDSLEGEISAKNERSRELTYFLKNEK